MGGLWNDTSTRSGREHNCERLEICSIMYEAIFEVASRKYVLYNALETVDATLFTCIHPNTIDESNPDDMGMVQLIMCIEDGSNLSHTEFLDDAIGQDGEKDYEEEEGGQNEEDLEYCGERGYISDKNDGRNCRRKEKASASRRMPKVPVNGARYKKTILLSYYIRSALENENVLDVLRKLIHVWKTSSNVS